MKYKIQCPAKINLTLKVFKKEGDFHPIESIMQTISLYDYLIIEINGTSNVNFSGNSKEISYDKNNLVIKGMEEFFKTAQIKNPSGMDIYLEKNIPTAAGLAGGSTDCAGMIYFLNCFYNALDNNEIKKINSKLGSDINFCYQGSRALCKGKGDDMTPLEFEEFPISIVKPKNLKISTKDAYLAFDNLKEKSNMDNDLEFAMLPFYEELRELHAMGFQMSGSGPSFFIKKEHADIQNSHGKYEIYENLKTVNKGVSLI